MITILPREGRPRPTAGFVFGRRPDGSHRYVRVAAGNPGWVVLGQRGTIDGVPGGIIRVASADIPAEVPFQLLVEVQDGGGVAVSVDWRTLLRAEISPVPGRVGLAAGRGRVRFDDVTIFGGSGVEGVDCALCHSGSDPLAPDVMRYWDGSWWDNEMGGGSAQQGGHGDPDGLVAVRCTGCHDLGQSPETHRNGVLEGRWSATPNTYHLRAEFIAADPVNPWDVQVTFDDFCYRACHQPVGVKPMTHEKDGYPVTGAVAFGTQMTILDGESICLPVDSDLSSLAGTEEPDYAPCVSCHDPHGTGTPDVKGIPSIRSNRMLRMRWYWSSEICKVCHL